MAELQYKTCSKCNIFLGVGIPRFLIKMKIKMCFVQSLENLSSFLPFILLSDWKRLNCIKACYKNRANIILLSLYMFDRLYDIICWVRVITFATVRASFAVWSMFQLSLDTYSHKTISFSNNCDISFEENLHEILYLVLIP